MDPRTRRWLVPLAAAAAVLGVFAVLWAQGPAGPDRQGAGFGGATPSDGGTGASSVPGSPGTGGGTPGDPGSPPPTGSPDLPDGGLTPTPGPGGPTPLAQAVESYFPRTATRIALNYTTGVPECYGKVDDPVVVETPDAVVVTLPKRPPKNDRDVACIDIALTSSVDIRLDAPLGDRQLLDGSRDDRPVERADAPYGDDEPAS